MVNEIRIRSLILPTGVDTINEDIKMENNIENYQIEQAEALMEDLELASEKTGEVLKQVRIPMRK